MERLNSISGFMAMQARLLVDRNPEIPTIIISAGTCGQASGANDLIRITKREILAKKLTEKLQLRITGCHGFCQMEPSVLVEPGNLFYPKIGIKDMMRIIDAVCQGKTCDDLFYPDPDTGDPIPRQSDIPFFKKQVRTILSRNEKVDPIRIFNYIENDGYSAWCRVLEKNDPDWVIAEIKRSGLRGRGGAGFPTGQKWEMLAKQPNGKGKFIVCNADEGDPGAYMDRSVLEGNPHSIIEGMIIGAFATGATEGIIYVRNEYPLAIKHLLISLRQARELGLLGKNILGSGFSFDIQIVKGAGAFVCGEETALIHSIEGKMGEPRQRPPYPIEHGINGRPTVINNVETWANIPIIIQFGAKEFTKTGTTGNSGTKIFSLVGKVKNTGLVEVPMGTTLKEIIYDIGGGAVGNARIKAVQTGGPSGGCVPATLFDLPIDYDSLAKAGSIMGSGGMIVLDDNSCTVDLAKYYMNFLKDESCGKCFTCRKGTQRLHEILSEITQGKAELSDLALLQELAVVMKDTTLCGLGQSAANPVLSTLQYFRQEYREHIVNQRCPAGACKELVGAACQTTCPLGTEAWHYIAHIARGEYEEAYRVIRAANPFPSICARVCHHPCEDKCRAGVISGQPIAIRALKRFITDRIDPAVYAPLRKQSIVYPEAKVAIVGAGPAGLTAAHYLSLSGYPVTIFDAERKPGGMMFSTIPAYRLPREVIEREIESLVDQNITLKLNTKLGRDITIDGLFTVGFKAVFLALGAHQSKPLNLAGEDAKGIFSSMQFLNDFNVHGKKRAKGVVGIIGGGNSAVDAARVAIRQENVQRVTIFYRRTRNEMPAYAEEIEAAIQEGVALETLVSPVEILTTGGKLTGLICQHNRLGEIDTSGRRRPQPIAGSDFTVPLDTLIIAISEGSDLDCISVVSDMQIETDAATSTVRVNRDTLCTNRPGVFAGGDLTTGPNTIVDAIADGKKAAVMIDNYLQGRELKPMVGVRLPEVYVAPAAVSEEVANQARVETPRALVQWRKRGFAEVEMSLTVKEAIREASRCLRCDLEFTQVQQAEEPLATIGGKSA